MTTLTKVTIGMPRLGETMEQGTIANWLIKPGDEFKRGDALLELETDKTLVEYPALGSGTLLETLVGPGDIVDVGAPIAVIESADVWDSVDKPTTGAETVEQTQLPVVPTASPEPAEGLRATPVARRLARQHNVALGSITGTGRRGRIEAIDIETLVGKAVPSAPAQMGKSQSEKIDPILFVHGFAGLGSNWATMRAGLQKRGITNSAPDLPCHGRNTSNADSVSDLIEWLVDHIDQFDHPVHLVGHSLGGHVTAVAAQRRPDKVSRLSIIAPAGCGVDINGAFINGMANARTAGELRHLLRLLGPKASKLNDEALDAMTDEMAKGRLQALAGDMARGDVQCIDTISALAGLADHMPVTAVFGVVDQVIPKEHVFNMPPHVATHIIRTGHMPHWDAPGQLEKIITRPI